MLKQRYKGYEIHIYNGLNNFNGWKARILKDGEEINEIGTYQTASSALGKAKRWVNKNES